MFVIFGILSSYCHAYDSIIGIPDPPSVLMDADVDMYLGQTYDFSKDERGVTTYPVSSSGHPYTHYIDMDDPNATDTDNPYGTEAVPRVTLPLQESKHATDSSYWIPSGSIIEIHNGPYNPSILCAYSETTSDKPVFIRGYSSSDKPILSGFPFYIHGDYIIIENIEMQSPDVNNIGSITTWYNGSVINDKSPNHIAIRDCVLTGPNDVSSVNGISLYSGNGSYPASYMLVSNCEISYYGKYDHTIDVNDLNDAFGVASWGYASYVWIIGNNIHHNGGDSVQIGNNSARNTQYVYIGGNNMHHDRENAVDIKQAEDVIISQNTMHDYLDLNRPDNGMICTTHSGSIAGGDCPKNIWYIFNQMYDADARCHSGFAVDGLYFICNLIKNIPYSPPDANDVSEVFYTDTFASTESHYYLCNTMYNCEQGFNGEIDSNSASVYIYNNIFGTLSEGVTGKYHISVEKYPNRCFMDYNLFYQSGGSASFQWGSGNTYSGLSALQAGESVGDNCVEGDPDLVNPLGDNFYLQSGSPAENAALSGNAAGVVKDAFDAFYNLYGIDIRDYDYGENTRPQSGWDIGALEGSGPQTRYLLSWTGN
jgi:hypothetical protein